MLIPTFSPQGDGNVLPVPSSTKLSPALLIPTFSPQGDGNGSVVLDASTSGLYNVDPYLFPARGRKLNLQRF